MTACSDCGCEGEGEGGRGAEAGETDANDDRHTADCRFHCDVLRRCGDAYLVAVFESKWHPPLIPVTMRQCRIRHIVVPLPLPCP